MHPIILGTNEIEMKGILSEILILRWPPLSHILVIFLNYVTSWPIFCEPNWSAKTPKKSLLAWIDIYSPIDDRIGIMAPGWYCDKQLTYVDIGPQVF